MGAPKMDLEIEPLEALDWSPSEANKSLELIAQRAMGRGVDAAGWYVRNRKGMRRMARALRLGAILLVAAAGVLPMIQQLTKDRWALEPVWASIVLAVAVLLVGIDRFFGMSSGWIRFVVAEGQIRSVLQAFELDWNSMQAARGGQPPTPEQLQESIGTVKAFLAQIGTIVTDETNRWVTEFQEALKQVEEQVRAAAPGAQSGSLVVSVSNGDAVASPGWTLAVDGGAARTFTGKSAVLIGLLPGDRAIVVQGTIGGKALQAATVATVKAGSSTTVQLALA